MADTLYTKDGKMHVLLEPKDAVNVIREYCGADAVAALQKYVFGFCDEIQYTADLSAADKDHHDEIVNQVKNINNLFL